MKNLIKLTIFISILGITSCKNRIYVKQETKEKENTTDVSKKEHPTVVEDTTIQKLKEPLKSIVKNIQWFGQASVKIVFSKGIIYIDPYSIDKNDKADYVFITHSHQDHCDMASLIKITNTNTKIIGPKDVCENLGSSAYTNLQEVEPGNSFTLDGIKVNIVPSYNIDKNFHPKENNWVGYILEVDGIKIYHPGDTDQIPEMKDIDCDLAFMPIGQTYTMDSVEEAVEAVLNVKAKVAIPFHYGVFEGSYQDAEKFKSLLLGKVDVIIKQRI